MEFKIFEVKIGRNLCFGHIFALFIWLDVFVECDWSFNSRIRKTLMSDQHEKSELNSENYRESETNYSWPVAPKCCDIGYGFTFENKSMCIKTENEFLPDFEDWTNYSKIAKTLPIYSRYEYYIGDPCMDGKYILDLTSYPYDKYSVYSNGTLWYLDHIYTKEEFCIESVNSTIRVFICFGVDKDEYVRDIKFVVYAIGLLTSVPFLIGTALIYLCIDMLRDLRGKSLSCHFMCLAMGYLFLALVQLVSEKLNEEVCMAAGFTIQFFFVAAFFWLNAICYDTWRCINNDFRCIRSHAASEKVMFCYYFIYGFYGPVILSIVSLIMDLEPAIPESYLKPNFGFQSCWFYSDDAALPYFYGPVALTICINIIFFVLSARKVYTEQRKRMKITLQDRCSDDGAHDKALSIKIYVKTLQECVLLFCLMGINWTAEIISWAVGGSDWVWLISDIFNTLQGIMIFYLFVVRPLTVRSEVKRQLHKTWRKLITCNCRYKEDNKHVHRHWHPELYGRTAETSFTSDNNQFLETLVQPSAN